MKFSTLVLNLYPPVIFPYIQNSTESISPQPSHLPPSPQDPDHVTSNDSAHDAAVKVGLQSVGVFRFVVAAFVNGFSDLPPLHRRQTT